MESDSCIAGGGLDAPDLPSRSSDLELPDWLTDGTLSEASLGYLLGSEGVHFHDETACLVDGSVLTSKDPKWRRIPSTASPPTLNGMEFGEIYSALSADRGAGWGLPARGMKWD